MKILLNAKAITKHEKTIATNPKMGFHEAKQRQKAIEMTLWMTFVNR